MWTHFPKEPRRPFGSQEGLQYSFRELALALTEPAPWPGDAHKIHRFGNGHGSCRQFTEPAHLELLVKLDEQVRAALKGAFSDGKATGSNLLVRLASGDLSTTDFIEKKEQV
ncbi:hypothetical protein HOL82_03505 [Candidatus Woesearchaeota archaeon]|nr:hypothetical protein [Candidatus Woesearchaeota archaeon]